MEKVLDVLLKIARVLVGGVLGFVLLIGGLVFLCQDMAVIWRFSKEGVFAPAFLGSRLCISLTIMAVAALFLRFCFDEKLQDKVGYGQLIAVLLLFLLCGGVLTAMNEGQTVDFEWVEYHPEVVNSPVHSLYESCEVDYSKDRLEVDCYSSFITDSFRQGDCVQVVEDPTCTDKVKVEVYYRGVECELNVYAGDDYFDINLWEKDYSVNDMSTEDWVYMYKHKVDIEYCDRYAIEKLVIRTAYPDKLDISDIDIY